MNITYRCNNQCLYCISDTTKNKRFDIKNPLKLITETDYQYNLSSNDIFIINGGEPTLSPFFEDIIAYLYIKKCKIIVYSNGRNLSNSNIKQIIFSSNVRWIIPFYGIKETHDYYTGSTGSFDDTFSSISSIPESMRGKFCIKLLLKDIKQINDFKQLLYLLKWQSEVHLSMILTNDISARFDLSTSTQSFIDELYSTYGKVKLSNIPLCCLSEQLRKALNRYNDKHEFRIDEYYFIDYNKVYQINYNTNHNWSRQCKNCKYLHFCPDNSKKYRALCISNNSSFLDFE